MYQAVGLKIYLEIKLVPSTSGKMNKVENWYLGVENFIVWLKIF